MSKKFFTKIGILTGVILVNIYPSACFSFYTPVVSSTPVPIPPKKFEVNLIEYLNKLTCVENDTTTLEENRYLAKMLKLESSKLEKGIAEGSVLITSDLYYKLRYMTNNCDFTNLIK